MKMKYLTLLVVVLLMSLSSFAQILTPVKWQFDVSNKSKDSAVLIFTAKIDQGWHVYDTDLPDGGPVSTSFKFEPSDNYKLAGKMQKSPSPKDIFDPTFQMELRFFENQVEFKQPIKLTGKAPDNFKIKGTLEYMCCNDETCLPPTDLDFSFTIKNKKKTTVASTVSHSQTANSVKQAETGVTNPKAKKAGLDSTKKDVPASEKTIVKPVKHSTVPAAKQSLWMFLLLAFVGGLAAILTPCVFPMIPMTVSFFMHSGDNKVKSRLYAIIYGISIIAIYTIVGTLVAVIFGPDAANWLSTHWLPNTIFFVVFMLFAFSFFGMYEIILPSWLVNGSDKQADKGGFIGSFFMALTLVLVSFSCTGPIVGAILVESAGGEVLKPIVGMFGFSLAFALPFTFFALFPGLLNKLPKSGGWLNSVKVVLGFIELALGLKFLSIADQTYHWGILDREVYLALWIVIFTLMGFYLLGKLRFAHDDEVKTVSVPRLVLAILTFSFVVYMIPGMFGAPLKALSGYLPPQTTQDFDINKIVRNQISLAEASGQMLGGGSSSNQLCEKPKYSDFLELPHGLKGYFDYEQGMACAKAQHKPVFIDFTGHGCVNCRKMEANVWSDPRVLKRLENDYVIIALYVDDKTELPKSEWVTSSFDGKVKKTIGKKYADFETTRFGTNAQPYYVLLDNDGNELVTPKAYDPDVEDFIEFLDNGLAKYNGNN